MKDQIVEMDNLSLPFTVLEDKKELYLAKSQTRVKDANQLRLLTKAPKEVFVPLDIKEEGDAFFFSFHVNPRMKKWDDIKKLHRNEKLRLLCNLTHLNKFITSRMTFFIHPDNILFDDNLMPHIIYRGVRELIPPYELGEQAFLNQLKCFSIALLSNTLTFDQLYNGALEQPKDTEFEKQVQNLDNLKSMIDYLDSVYIAEQQKTEKTMELVPTKRFVLFKRLTFIFGVLCVLLAGPLIYFRFVTLPYQESLQNAHEKFLALEFKSLIKTLSNIDAEKLPDATKYTLAYAYVSEEELSDNKKTVILNNINVKSDQEYLLYWIYNGRGDFKEAMDVAKYIDDPQLIMYGLIKQIEQVKKDPELSGSERDDKVDNLQNELQTYREEYNLINNEEENKPDIEEQGDDKNAK
ncbi:type VII secretion protein EssB [Paraliobacillus sp. JSM ZJ581]|uniref:type VII secretion protein EssB n=1 Tax=Paraliobacillus sp. JSM ZJ581 TaxID=3342118 RepID=UPI0035A95FAB